MISEYRAGLSRSTSYYFIVDGSTLRRLLEFAVQKTDIDDLIEYHVDLEMIGNRPIVEILVSNSGLLCHAYIYDPWDMLLDHLKRKPRKVSLSYLNNLQFSYLRPYEATFLRGDWRTYYIPMLSELRNFVDELRKLGIYVRMPNLLQCQVESRAEYPLSYLIPYDDRARRKSLEGLTKFIHQAWVMLKIIDRLWRATGKMYVTIVSESLKLISFEQSSTLPVATFEVQGKIYSVWWEFDLTPHTMCGGALRFHSEPQTLSVYHERALRYQMYDSIPLRPDIVILRNTQSCSDILERGLDVQAVIECKNQDYEVWADKIRDQIKPYAEVFNPTNTLLISMKSVPQYVKEYLKKYGVRVIDEAYPGGRGVYEITKIAEYLVLR